MKQVRGVAWLAGVLSVLGACASSPPEGVVCTLEARSAFAVTVTDSVTGANLAPAARVRVTEGTFQDSLSAAPGGAIYSGAYERAGVYTVTVEHPDYQTWQQSGVEVTRDECHVQTRALSARLRPR